MQTTDCQNQLMWHTYGLTTGEDRNWFGTCKGGKDSIEFEKLVDAGFATSRDATSWMGDDVIYSLTEAGKQIAISTRPKPPKLTRSQKRYKRYLEYGDSFGSFLDFCRWDADHERSWN